MSETNCMPEAHIWCIQLGKIIAKVLHKEGVGEWKHIIIASYKNRGKINSVSTANCFCNIWKEVNFTEVCPDCNFIFFVDIYSCSDFLWLHWYDLGEQVIWVWKPSVFRAKGSTAEEIIYFLLYRNSQFISIHHIHYIFINSVEYLWTWGKNIIQTENVVSVTILME